VASLLETTVASVNSALQRARATLAGLDVLEADILAPDDPAQRELLDRYVAAFTSYDVDALTALLHEDATMSMPPLSLWLRGPEQVGAFLLGPGAQCRGSRLVPTAANGLPAFAQYRSTGPWALVVLEITGGRIAGLTYFLDVARIFPLFGLPETAPFGDHR
jgi:RNA polymerase sigma-70 factor (ECF subfamily)